ncbi:hypothetical protein ACF3N0_00930 [Moraxella atlantae]|uniref:hypothetical protein n=1 Tax=Faucicola atlantae TaxID=34059 RepID=UPI0012E7F39D|nr:hypothetical protein [Moraxella atlantae]
MAWIIGIIAILLIGGLIELFYEKGFRNKLSAFFGGCFCQRTKILAWSNQNDTK